MLRVRTVLNGWQGAPGLMTHYFLGSGTPLADAQTAVDRVHSAIAANPRAWADGVTLQVQGEVDALDAATGAITDTYSVTQPASVPGGSGSDPIGPTAIAMLGKYTTNTFVAGRRVRGRTFFSPVSAASNSISGAPSFFFLSVVGSLLAALLPAVPGTVNLVVWHRPKLGTGGLAAPVVSTSTSGKYAVLTSRRD